MVARYDKIHLFDVTVDEGSEVYTESYTNTLPGAPVGGCGPAAFGKLGMVFVMIYVFPELYRGVAAKVLRFLVVP